jgi:hypothetical protein
MSFPVEAARGFTSTSREGLHLYAHCLRSVPGGIALLAINNSWTATSTINIAGESQGYTLSADTLKSPDVKLNGNVLRLGADDASPGMVGVEGGRADAAFPGDEGGPTFGLKQAIDSGVIPVHAYI